MSDKALDKSRRGDGVSIRRIPLDRVQVLVVSKMSRAMREGERAHRSEYVMRVEIEGRTHTAMFEVPPAEPSEYSFNSECLEHPEHPEHPEHQKAVCGGGDDVA